jgi:hypothetical protein
MTIIFGFKTLDSSTGEMVMQPVKSTEKRIAGIPNAEIIEATREEVPDAFVDATGRFKTRS